MSEIDYSTLRSLTAREVCHALEQDGFTLARQRGSHQRYAHPDGRRVTVPFTRSGDTSGGFSVDYATGNNTYVPCDPADPNNIHGVATQNCDFTIASGTLNFAQNETSKSFTVSIIDDAYVEGDETFPVKLSNPVGASLGTPSTATVTIIDNDTALLTSPLPKRFATVLRGANERPNPTNSTAFGGGIVLLNDAETAAKVGLLFSGLSGAQTAAHIHGPADTNGTAQIIFPLANGTVLRLDPS